MTGEWQLRFDGGRQQRYLPDRRSVLRYVLAIAAQTAEPVFEVWGEGEDPERHARLKEESYSMPLNRGVGA